MFGASNRHSGQFHLDAHLERLVARRAFRQLDTHDVAAHRLALDALHHPFRPGDGIEDRAAGETGQKCDPSGAAPPLSAWVEREPLATATPECG